MTEQEQKNELAKTLTGYEDCGDCLKCQFHGCCYEEEMAERLWLQGWRKDMVEAKRASDRAIKIGKIMQSYGSRPLS